MRNPHEAVGQACDIRDSGVRVLPLVLPRHARFDVVPGRVTPRHHAVVVEPDRAP